MTTLSFPALQVGDTFMCRDATMFSDMTFGRVYQVDGVLDYSINWLDDIGDVRVASAEVFHSEFKLGGFEIGDTVKCIKKPAAFDFSYMDTHIGGDYKIRSVNDDFHNEAYIQWVDSVSDFPEDTLENFIKHFIIVARLGVPVELPTDVSYTVKPAALVEVKPKDMSISLITLAMQARDIELTTGQAEALMDVMVVYANGLTK